MKKLRFLIIPFVVLGCVLLLASCKGTGKFYYRGRSNTAVIEITSDKWIESYEGRTTEKNIEWVSDTVFKKDNYLFYCDGDFFYNIEYPTEWYSSKVIKG